MAKMGYLYDGTLCTACRGCQVACKQWNELPAEKTGFFAEGGGYQNPHDLTVSTWNLIRFREKSDKNQVQWLFQHWSCNHCTDAACFKACPVEPTKAMTRHPDFGTVYVNQDLCIGCGTCMEVCPFKIPHIDEALEKSFKCRACLDRLENGKTPSCVNTCNTGALQFGEHEKLMQKAKAKLEQLKAKGKTAFIYGQDQLGGLGKVYLLLGSIKDYNLPIKPKIHEKKMEYLKQELRPYRQAGRLNRAIIRRTWAIINQRETMSL